jgi:hypothetical protein
MKKEKLTIEWGDMSVEYDAEDYTEYVIRDIGGRKFLVVLKGYQWVGVFAIDSLIAFAVLEEDEEN